MHFQLHLKIVLWPNCCCPFGPDQVPANFPNKWNGKRSNPKKRRPFITFLLLLLLLLCFLFVLFSEVIRFFGFYFAFQGSFHFSFSTWLNHRKICSGSLCACHENLKENSSKNLLIKANNKIHFGERSKCSNLSAPSTRRRSRFAAELLCVRFFFFFKLLV